MGRLPGVKKTKIGHLDGKEIVEVEYDPTQTNLTKMSEALASESSFGSLIVDDPIVSQKAKNLVDESKIEINNATPRFIESKHSLRTRHPELYELNLTEQQKIALNSWSYFGGEMPDVLTEQQKQILKAKAGSSSIEKLMGWLQNVSK